MELVLFSSPSIQDPSGAGLPQDSKAVQEGRAVGEAEEHQRAEPTGLGAENQRAPFPSLSPASLEALVSLLHTGTPF